MWLSTEDILIRGGTRKLAVWGAIHHPKGHQPYGRSPQTTCYHEVSTSNLPRLCLTPPLPPASRIIDGGETFTVNRLLDCRPRGRGLQYLVDWEGYGPEERSWTPARFILDKTLITNCHKNHPVPPVKTPRGAS